MRPYFLLIIVKTHTHLDTVMRGGRRWEWLLRQLKGGALRSSKGMPVSE